jgi:hypothetical protein
MKSSLLLSMSCAVIMTACGVPRSHSIRDLSALKEGARSIADYQIGTKWGKAPVMQSDVDAGTAIFKRATLATAKVSVGFGSATAFVLGEKNGKVLFATNHHVIEDQSGCSMSRLTFEFLGLSRLACDEVIDTNTDLDLTIFTIKNLPADAKSKLLAVAKSFTKSAPVKGTNLLTIGYGVAGNPGGKLMAGQDEDCKTFSPDGETRFMADPDEFNPGPYKTWMFASGCDVSHGDSGSAVVDRSTGEVVGILTTGKIPKDAKVREASYLKNIFEDSSEDVWKELSYVVPASKIQEIAGDLIP